MALALSAAGAPLSNSLYNQTHNTYHVDAGAGVIQGRHMEDGSYVWTTPPGFCDRSNMVPWGRTALGVAQMRISQALVSLRLRPEDVRFAGAHGDGVCLLRRGFDAPTVLNKTL